MEEGAEAGAVNPILGTKKGRPAEAERESVAQLREKWADAIEKAVADAPDLSRERVDSLVAVVSARRSRSLSQG